jgi:HAD superfamily hydrolase (TIGR01458 family)
MSLIRGILLDVDGVLHVSMSPIPGATETLHWLKQKNYPFCLITNATLFSHRTLTHQLQSMGLPIEQNQLMTASIATANYLRHHYAGKRCWVLSKGDSIEDFWGIDLGEENADVVVIGGAEELLSYETMNRIFQRIMDGADLLAMHINLYWRTSKGLQLDSGSYVRALEIASGKQAKVLGKPDPAFFEQALLTLGIPAHEVIMVGDDLVNDIKAAQQIGMRGVWVCTGKHKKDSPLLDDIHPDVILPSIAELSDWLELDKQIRV